RRPNELRKPQHQQLEMTEVLDLLERYDVFADQSSAVFAGPPSRFGFAAAEKGLGKPAEPQQLFERVPILDLRLAVGERVKAKEMVAALKGIAAEVVEIESPASCDENLLTVGPAVVNPLEVVAPSAVLVQFVED